MDAARRGRGRVSEAVGVVAIRVPIAELRAADTPRLAGEDPDHVRVLAGVDAKLPPIVVHRRSMRVLDGMHRLRASILRGDQYIEVYFFDGDEDEGFIFGVEANINHGLPLTLADRRAAALRILRSNPGLSDRAIASRVGLSHKTVGALRRSPSGEVPHSDMRVGRDGRARPIDITSDRSMARALLIERPGASLRAVALAVGISPETARDVRRNMENGDRTRSPRTAPRRTRPITEAQPPPGESKASSARPANLSGAEVLELLEGLRRDPALHQRQLGRLLLRLLSVTMRPAQEWRSIAEQIPEHRKHQVARAARTCAQRWIDLAEQLDASTGDRAN